MFYTFATSGTGPTLLTSANLHKVIPHNLVPVAAGTRSTSLIQSKPPVAGEHLNEEVFYFREFVEHPTAITTTVVETDRLLQNGELFRLNSIIPIQLNELDAKLMTRGQASRGRGVDVRLYRRGFLPAPAPPPTVFPSPYFYMGMGTQPGVGFLPSPYMDLPLKPSQPRIFGLPPFRWEVPLVDFQVIGQNRRVGMIGSDMAWVNPSPFPVKVGIMPAVPVPPALIQCPVHGCVRFSVDAQGDNPSGQIPPFQNGGGSVAVDGGEPGALYQRPMMGDQSKQGRRRLKK